MEIDFVKTRHPLIHVLLLIVTFIRNGFKVVVDSNVDISSKKILDVVDSNVDISSSSKKIFPHSKALAWDVGHIVLDGCARKGG